MRQSLRAFAWPYRSPSWKRIIVSLGCVYSLILLAACTSTPTAQTAPTATPTAVTHATAVPALTPALTPTPTPVLPPSRGSTQLVYDDQTGTLLLFGGSGSIPTFAPNDTWTWNGSTWTQQHPTHAPPPRDYGAIAYDAMTHQVVLFGGLSDEGNTPMIGDTWTWDGSDWTQQHPLHSPSARDFASMAYDAATGQLVLFGGGGSGPRIAGMAPPPLNDTWTWNGSDWTQQHPATVPQVRSQAAMSYDSATRTLVLFGGLDAHGPTELNDTWIWNGWNWIQQYPATKPPFLLQSGGDTISFGQPEMTYNEAKQQMMLTLISSNENTNAQQLVAWLWNGATWAPQPGANLDANYGFLIYDAALQSVIALTFYLPPDSDVFEDKLWQWNGQAWKLLEDWS